MDPAAQRKPGPPHSCGTAVGTTPLDEGSARRRDLYLTKHNAHRGHPCHAGFETTQQTTGHRPSP